MKLLTKELLAKLPPLRSQENEADPMVICKFFTPDSGWTWYVLEFDGKDVFFGYVDGDYPELGSFLLSELERIRGCCGLRVERDLHFTPRRLSEVRDKVLTRR